MSGAYWGMATAYEEMNEAKNGMTEFISVLRVQSQRIDQLLEAMTHLSANIASSYISTLLIK